MAGLLKYFKHTRKKDSTLPDPDGPLSRDIPSSSIGITNTRVRHVQREASSERRSREPYISLIPAQIHAPTFYSLGVVGSYPFRHTVALLVCRYLPAIALEPC